jgi:uncharacterized protein
MFFVLLSSSMEIQHNAGLSKGVFYIEIDGERLAEMSYTKAGEDRIIIDHTEVSDKLRGKGAGAQLVKAAVLYAREKGIRIIPLCPFAKSVFEKKREEYKDVL